MWWLSLLIGLAVALPVVLVVSRRKKKRSVEKFVCDICHGTDCDCRRQNSDER